MQYEISVDGTVSKVELMRSMNKEKEIYEAKIDGEGNQTRITIENRTTESLLVSIDNRIYQVKQLKRRPGEVEFLLNGRVVKALLAINNRIGQRSISEKSDIATVNELVTSNFPAKVITVEAGKGSSLKDGDTILVLEAMKMEARIKAPRDCTVLEIFVRGGDMVSRGSKLAHLKFLS
jgi:biotin carboxyl carrier protein